MITKNFSWAEMQASITARKKGYDNSIPDDLKPNMVRLCRDVLQVIRDAYGMPIVVGSGYRCPKLNKAVGGVKNSQHMTAAAADIRSLSDKLTDNRVLWDVIMRLKEEGKIACRQIIWEYGKKSVGPDWIHIAVNDSAHTHRNNQIVYIGV